MIKEKEAIDFKENKTRHMGRFGGAKMEAENDITMLSNLFRRVFNYELVKHN